MIEANCIFMLVHNISNGLISLILSIISSVSSVRYFANNPCFLALLFFFIFLCGAPVDFPPCNLRLPLPTWFVPHPAGLLHGVPALVLAPQYFLSWTLFCFFAIY